MRFHDDVKMISHQAMRMDLPFCYSAFSHAWLSVLRNLSLSLLSSKIGSLRSPWLIT